MSWTKRELIEDAYAELALAGWDFDLTPDELQWGLRRLDTLMASWQAQGVKVGYAMSVSPSGGDLDQDSGLPVEVVEAVYMNLAVRLAAGKGKNILRSTVTNARASFDSLMARAALSQVKDQQFRSGVPSGAGNKDSDTFLSEPNVDPLLIGGDEGLQFGGN